MADAGGAREIDRAGQLGDEGQRLVERRRRVVPHRDVERFGRAAQRKRESLGLFGDDVEAEDLDGDETVARRLIGAEDGTERANANLVQDPEWAECGRRRKCAGVLSCQRRNSSGGSLKCNTETGILRALARVLTDVPCHAALTAFQPL